MEKNITQLFREFKSEAERQSFIRKQHETITELMEKNKKLEEEISHLKKLVTSSVPLIGQSPVDKMIISPEEFVIDEQVRIIQERAVGSELSLEDVKKLDILLKHSQVYKKEKNKNTVSTTATPISAQDLILIASKPKDE